MTSDCDTPLEAVDMFKGNIDWAVSTGGEIVGMTVVIIPHPKEVKGND